MNKEQIRTEIARIINASCIDPPTREEPDRPINCHADCGLCKADQILALFPQGEEDGLLSELGICKILGCTEDEYCECRSKNLDGVVPEENDYNEIMAVEACGDFQYAVDIVNAQHALDNQSKQAALKEQMERVMGIVVDSFYGHRNYAREAPGSVNWKEFLFSTLDHMENELVVALKSQLESE